MREAVAAVMPVGRLRYVGFSHVEADECGSLNEWLAAAPARGTAVRPGRGDGVDRRPGRPAAARRWPTARQLSLGTHRVRWLDTPHLPHAWECGFLIEESTRTLLCGDLFTQPGPGRQPLTEADILGPSEAFRHQMDYFSHAKNARGPH